MNGWSNGMFTVEYKPNVLIASQKLLEIRSNKKRYFNLDLPEFTPDEVDLASGVI